MSPKFSVVIATYERLDLLKATLESVWAQSFHSYEVIVVDDGSTDGTVDYLLGLGDRVTIIVQRNAGPGAARNAGAEVATGEYVAFLDSDDLWFPWTLSTYFAAINGTRPPPSFLIGERFIFNDLQTVGAVFEDSLQRRRYSDYLAAAEEYFFYGASALVVRLDVFKASVGFTKANVNGEDGDLCLKLGEAPGFVKVDAPVTFAYRAHESNLTHDIQKSWDGTWLQIQTERQGGYPGAGLRARERRQILTRQSRPVSLACLATGENKQAWQLYRATLFWHLSLWRWRYLLGFVAIALKTTLRPLTTRE